MHSKTRFLIAYFPLALKLMFLAAAFGAAIVAPSHAQIAPSGGIFIQQPTGVYYIRPTDRHGCFSRAPVSAAAKRRHSNPSSGPFHARVREDFTRARLF